jgi:hypothetical protein
MKTPRYFISINGAEAVSCESLGLAPGTLTRSNLLPDSLTMTQTRVRGAWAVTLAYDDRVRFWREDPVTEEMVSIFLGRCLEPEENRRANARSRQVMVMGVLQLAKEVQWTRGAWTPEEIQDGVSEGGEDDDPDANGHAMAMYYGYFYRRKSGGPAGRLIKKKGRQTVAEAVKEVMDNLIFAAQYNTEADEWNPTLASCFFPSSPQPRWEGGAAPVSMLEWLTRVLQIERDPFLQVDYSGSRPALRAGRFRDEGAIPLPTGGWPLLGGGIVRRREQEYSGISVFQSYESDPDYYTLGSDFFPTWAFSRRWLEATYPLSSPPNPLERRATVLNYASSGSSTAWDTLAAFIGPSVTQPVVMGYWELGGKAWSWIKPGRVLEVDGLRLNVQQTTHDLATERVRAEVGLPRQLGVDDMERLALWLRRNTIFGQGNI